MFQRIWIIKRKSKWRIPRSLPFEKEKLELLPRRERENGKAVMVGRVRPLQLRGRKQARVKMALVLLRLFHLLSLLGPSILIDPLMLLPRLEDRSPRASPRGLADHSVHNYSDGHHGDGGAGTLHLGTSGDPFGRVVTHVDTEVVQPSPSP
ncbi:hypothetical protein Tco_0197905 [Tanacetum coccineum]